jgi:hypothetical protein
LHAVLVACRSVGVVLEGASPGASDRLLRSVGL